ncbi:MAG: DMT family transporter [Pseudomonadota bacterium]
MNATQGDNRALAIGAMIAMTLSLSFGDAVVKGISGSLTLWQIFVLRSAAVIPILVVIWRLWPAAAARPIRPGRLGWVALRSGLLGANWVFYYMALPHLPLSTAAAVYYTLPLFITLFAAGFAGERVAPLGWLAVGIGFAGVALILRPDGGEISLYALLPLASAICYALAMIVTRNACREESPLALALVLNMTFIAVGLVASGVLSTDGGDPFLSPTWSPIGAQEMALLGILAAAILIGSIGTAVAYQNAPSSVIGPFDFCYVGFAVIWGAIFFGDWPDALSAAGILMIVAAGILSVRAGSRGSA